MTAFSFKDEFSVLKCLKTFKIIFLSPELIALPFIAAGLLDTRDFSVLKCLKTFKTIFLSPELIDLPLIAVGLQETFSILFYSCLKTHLIAFPF